MDNHLSSFSLIIQSISEFLRGGPLSEIETEELEDPDTQCVRINRHDEYDKREVNEGTRAYRKSCRKIPHPEGPFGDTILAWM